MKSVAHSVISLMMCCAFLCQAARGDINDQGETVRTSEERQKDILGAHSLTLPAPILKWDNAIPLGNGLTGGLLWGEKDKLKLSLDRGDLWDERTKIDFDPKERTFATFMKCYRNRDRGTWDRVFVAANRSIKWTKIPGGRLEVTLADGLQSKSFHLDFEKAIAKVTLSDGSRAEAFFPANRPIALLRLPKKATFKLIRPKSVDLLGYPAPQFSSSGNEVAYTQKTTESFNYAVAARWKEIDGHILVIIAITNSNESGSPLALAARAGVADSAVRHLVDFERAFVARNGFHLNGNMTSERLVRPTRRKNRHFTLEGNFLFMDAIHEMYMQSWGGKVRIFPAMADSWRDAGFRDLRAEGGGQGQRQTGGRRHAASPG